MTFPIDSSTRTKCEACDGKGVGRVVRRGAFHWYAYREYGRVFFCLKCGGRGYLLLDPAISNPR